MTPNTTAAPAPAPEEAPPAAEAPAEQSAPEEPASSEAPLDEVEASEEGEEIVPAPPISGRTQEKPAARSMFQRLQERLGKTRDALIYRLDRLFRIDLVPPTVVREVEGKRGSVQYWIEDATSLGQAIAGGHPVVPIPGFLLKRSVSGGAETATEGLKKFMAKNKKG